MKEKRWGVVEGVKGAPNQGEGTVTGLDLTILMAIDCCLNPNLESDRTLLIRRTQGVFTRSGTATTRRSPLAPSVERTEMSGNYSIALQHTPVSNSSYDEQRSDNLFNPSSH